MYCGRSTRRPRSTRDGTCRRDPHGPVDGHVDHAEGRVERYPPADDLVVAHGHGHELLDVEGDLGDRPVEAGGDAGRVGVAVGPPDELHVLRRRGLHAEHGDPPAEVGTVQHDRPRGIRDDLASIDVDDQARRHRHGLQRQRLGRPVDRQRCGRGARGWRRRRRRTAIAGGRPGAGDCRGRRAGVVARPPAERHAGQDHGNGRRHRQDERTRHRAATVLGAHDVQFGLRVVVDWAGRSGSGGRSRGERERAPGDRRDHLRLRGWRSAAPSGRSSTHRSAGAPSSTRRASPPGSASGARNNASARAAGIRSPAPSTTPDGVSRSRAAATARHGSG